MDPRIAEAIAPLIALISIGSFVLIGMHLRYKAKAFQKSPRDSEEMVEMRRVLSDLVEHTQQLGDEVAELQERIDFHERLLTRGRDAAGETP